MRDYQLTLPGRVRFGWGVVQKAGELASSLGRRAWLVCGSRTLAANGVVATLQQSLRAKGVECETLANLSHEPLVEDVDAAVATLRPQLQEGDFLVALGGGAAIDLAKAVAALATNREGDSVKDYLEGVGRGLTIDKPPLPLLAIPTTAGTGTEATRNAVISSLDPPFKKSLRSMRMVPTAVLIDPELTVSAPPWVTAHSGMDAITQLIEALMTRKANEFTSGLCREGLRLAIPALPITIAEPSNRAAREAMAHAAFLSGVALANAGLGLAHGVAAALGVQCGIPHGLACAVMLPSAMRFNRDVRLPELATIGRIMSGREISSDEAAADAAIEGIERLSRDVGIPQSLGALGVSRDQIPAIVTGSHGNSLNGNPRDVSDDDLTRLLERLQPNAATPQ